MHLEVTLGYKAESYFNIILYNNNFVKKWIKEFQWCLNNCNFDQNQAFLSLDTIETVENNLRKSCNIINKYLKNFIEIPDNILDQSQDYFNYLHLKFEKLNGTFDNPTRLLHYGPSELKNAIRNLNSLIHRIEPGKKSLPGLYLSFNKDQYRRQKFSDDDYEYFEFSIRPGTLFLHYAELGKDYSSLYLDNLPFNYTGFRNLQYYSGEAALTFVDLDIDLDNGFKTWLIEHGVDPKDKKLGHGKIPLGYVENLTEIESLIIQYRYLNKIKIRE